MPIVPEKLSNRKEWLSCRNVLWYLSFFGFAIDYMLRINLSLAIVAMVVPRHEAVATAQCAKNLQMNYNLTNSSANTSSLINFKDFNVTKFPNTSLESTIKTEHSLLINHTQYPDRFAWNEYEQGLALGGYYWLHWAAQIPGGLLARRYGTKLIFGWANFAPALLGFLIPFFARYHLYAFVFLRVFQGMVAGLAWPAMHNMTAKWIPPNERSKFISSYLGSSIGAAITYPLCAILINLYGWASVFYVTSVLGVIWYGAWLYLIYDTPQEHPRISIAEKSYILESLGDSINHGIPNSIPWKSILTSGPVWLVIISECGTVWGVLTLNSESPSYFNYIHGWNISAAGMISAAPHLMRMVFSYGFSSIGDWLLRMNKISRTRLRKFATLVSNAVQSALLLGLAFSGCHPILAIVFMVAAMSASGANSAGTLASSVDLSPNYASVLIGVSNTVATSAGFISPTIVGILTNNNQTIEQWRLVYMIAVTILFLSGGLFIIFGTSEIQPWNNVSNAEVGEELQRLRSIVDKVQFGKIPNGTDLGDQKNEIS